MQRLPAALLGPAAAVGAPMPPGREPGRGECVVPAPEAAADGGHAGQFQRGGALGVLLDAGRAADLRRYAPERLQQLLVAVNDSRNSIADRRSGAPAPRAIPI